ncbi:hypothetical protein UCDDS831_g08985 [Diplodia seriata]|uniref:Uncharacterized protein n=1 Tax=Diplodia seriata TaxID=420778 RepID=A0A0G2DRX2_9PEZI|nr:hypothetical protein UCDDS831_g08985 [Diplodia seriata]
MLHTLLLAVVILRTHLKERLAANAPATSKAWRDFVVAKLTEGDANEQEQNAELVQELNDMTEDGLV